MDKEIAVEVAKFTKNYRERYEELISVYAKEEKSLNDQYHSQLEDLHRRHRKQSEKLHRDLEVRRKNLRKKLNEQVRAEYKFRKQYIESRSQSASRILTRNLEGSVYSLDDQRINISVNDLASEVPRAGSSNAEKNGHSNTAQSKWNFRRFKKYAEHSDSELKTLNQLKQDAYERLQYDSKEARSTIAELEWKFLEERQELRFAHLEQLADLKHRRLAAIGQMKLNQIKGYFAIHRKGLTDQHCRDLDARNRASQDALKRLVTAQSIERQTACRLAQTTAKGHRRVNKVLNSVSGILDDPLDNGSLVDFTKDLQRPNSMDARIADMLFPNTDEQTLDEYTSTNGRGDLQASSNTEPTDSNTKPVHYERWNRPMEGSVSGSISNCRYLPSKPGIRPGLRHAKSVQSLQSGLLSCDQIQRVVITNLSKHHVEQWSDVMSQERSLTDTLMQAQAEQKRLLINAETAALKRAQLEQQNRVAHLSVILEATNKFVEREFRSDRQRLIDFYFGKTSEYPRSGLTNETTDVLTLSDRLRSDVQESEKPDHHVLASAVEDQKKPVTNACGERIIICRADRAK